MTINATAASLPCYSSLPHLRHAFWPATPAASANLPLVFFSFSPSALHSVIRLTGCSFANQQCYLSSGLWLIQCQIVVCVMWDLRPLFSCLPACAWPYLFRTCVQSLFSWLTCLLSLPSIIRLSNCCHPCWTYLPHSAPGKLTCFNP